MSRKKRDGLASKVMKFNFPRDQDGEFIPYCDFQHHRGIVLRTYVCEQRQCTHYRKFYLNGTARVDFPREDKSCYLGQEQ
jgi:hypothetical protein